MNRHTGSSVFSNRPASRRLHRRFADVGTRCEATPLQRNISARPQTIVSLPQELVRQAGMFELLAAEMRIAELEKSLAELGQVAFLDPLTGALNRRGFERAYQGEISRARRNDSSLALVLLDLDDFKRINDTFGHETGDRALRHLVELVGETMRPSDAVCRFGGEEFVLMLPETSRDEAHAAVGRLLAALAERPVPGTRICLSFSAGVVVHDYFESLEEALGRADAAAYAAKRAGKHRAVAA